MSYHLLITYCSFAAYKGIVRLYRLPKVYLEIDFITANIQEVIILFISSYKEEVETSS